MFRIRRQETGAQIGQPVSRVRRARTGATSHGHSEFREQGHDGQLHSEGQHRVNRFFIRLTRPPRCMNITVFRLRGLTRIDEKGKEKKRKKNLNLP